MRTEQGEEMADTPTEGGLRVGLVQFRPLKGRVDENLARIAGEIEAGTRESDLLVFPETAVSGYFVEGGVEEVALPAGEVVRKLGSPPDAAPDVVLGLYEAAGGGCYNSALWLTPGPDGWKIVHLHRKVFLPTYRIFDEARFVSPGTRVQAFDTRFGRMGILICEELFHSLVPSILALDGANLLVTVAAPPGRDYRPGSGRPGNMEAWDVAARAVTQEHGIHLVISHLVGTEGGKIFPGGSTFYLPGGEIGARGPLFEEARVMGELDGARIRRARSRGDLLADLKVMLPHLLDSLLDAEGRGHDPRLPEAEEKESPRAMDPQAPARALPDPEDRSFLEVDADLLEEALITFLRDEIRERRGFTDVVVGVSGGVDSAVSLNLAVRALGAEHVHAFMLPYATSSPESRKHALQVLERAGVEGRTIDIAAGVDAYIQEEEPDLPDLRRGNLAARFRALVLWDQAARLGALVLGTGNKSERLLGYYTWHADDSPPINPLGDLFKTQVLAIARHLGVPEAVIEKAPSADLVPGVHDEDELGVAYRTADPILHWILEGFTPDDLIRAGFGPEAVKTVHGRYQGTHWKRHLPTVAVVSSTALNQFHLRPVDY
jgi:NAD+ synthase (glutamine-hydrolysing)